MQTETTVTQIDFFEHVFGTQRGYVCIAYAPTRGTVKTLFLEEYFEWPTEAMQMLMFVEGKRPGHNIWFCAQLLVEKKRLKGNVDMCYALWADLDTCAPENVIPPATAVVMSSPGRYQGYWHLEHPIPAPVAEDYSCRLAYAHASLGADISGWDLTQLLRVPGTTNYKYDQKPLVELERLAANLQYSPQVFDELPRVASFSAVWRPPPSRMLDASTVLGKYGGRIPSYMRDTISKTPPNTADWSSVLWRLMLDLYETGLTPEEVYSLCDTAGCNKWKRDDKPERLWHDVLRAEQAFSPKLVEHMPTASEVPQFENVEGDTFVEEYVRWASTQTDAPTVYHEATAFMLLSAVASSGLEIESSGLDMKTNLWFIILGETTLTRKTTSMKMGMKIIEDIDDNLVLATNEGSIEGLIDALAGRPHQASVFHRDEIVGMMKAMNRKDYLSGMMEMFCQLYDGHTVKRVLRKDTITVRDPTVVFFGGGIKDAFLRELTEDHVSSGFIPRFLFVIGESDLTKTMRLGKKTDKNRIDHSAIAARLRRIYGFYNQRQQVVVPGLEHPAVVTLGKKVMADLTNDAWATWNDFNDRMLEFSHNSESRNRLLPITTRTCFSALKMAALLAASEREPEMDDRLEVTADNVKLAIKYVMKWFPSTLQVVENVDVSQYENTVRDVFVYIKANPGVQRGRLMRHFKLKSYEAKEIFQTMQERLMIRVSPDGKTVYPS